MKLAPAIEEFIQYKQALGSSYTTSSRVLRAFLRKTGNVEFDEPTEQHPAAFLLGHEAFDSLHYAGLSVYKIGIILLNLVPLVALYVVS